MTGVAVRETIFEVLAADPILNGLGYTEETIYPAYSPDSPQSRRFLIIRWGATTPGIGRANTCDMSLWVYDRDASYDAIERALMRIRPAEKGGAGILDTLVGARLAAGGAVLGIDWSGASLDLFDDAYIAYTRNETYRLTASGN